MSQLPALADVLDETMELIGVVPRASGFHLEPALPSAPERPGAQEGQ